MMNKRKFKEVFNEIGSKYLNMGIQEMYIDYNLLCFMTILTREINDLELRDELEEYLELRKRTIEEEEVKE